MKFKLTALEKKWVLYDVANSAFTLLIFHHHAHLF